MLFDSDTITAIATAKGHSALSVIRISGTKTPEILRQCFQSKSFNSKETHRVWYGVWTSSLDGKLLDEVTVLNYTDGRGFTGEDACEIICHGGIVVTELVLESVLAAGARLARPGEFSYRAVLNGKMDLSQAENILQLITARSPKRALQALQNIKGELSRSVKDMEDRVIYLLAHLEASIDFNTEDIQPVDFSEMEKIVAGLREKISNAVESFRSNQKASQGLRVVLTGRPNAGKSSLLNQLCGRDRSIVTEIAGTTRDVIETEAIVNGQLVKYIDTAGVRESSDEIERLGIEKTQAEVRAADIIIYVVDGNLGLSLEDAKQLQELRGENLVICFNKMDLVNSSQISTDILDLSTYKKVLVSCQDGRGMSELRKIIENSVGQASDSETNLIIGTQRQEEAFVKCSSNLEAAQKMLNEKASPDLISFELKNALVNLKQVLGEELSDEVMDKVFKEFCIGK